MASAKSVKAKPSWTVDTPEQVISLRERELIETLLGTEVEEDSKALFTETSSQ